MSNTNIKGGKELMAFLSELPAKMERNIMRSALNQGAKVVQKDIEANAPVDEGDLRKSFKRSTRVRRGRVVAKVVTKDPAAHWVEYGTAAHQIQGKGGGYLFFKGRLVRSVHHPGARAKPFVRPSLDARSADAIRAVGAQINKRLTVLGIESAPIEVDE